MPLPHLSYLNNIIEQDHRAIKRRINARRTIQGYEVVHMIRKGQVRWLPKGDAIGVVLIIQYLLEVE